MHLFRHEEEKRLSGTPTAESGENKDRVESSNTRMPTCPRWSQKEQQKPKYDKVSEVLSRLKKQQHSYGALSECQVNTKNKKKKARETNSRKRKAKISSDAMAEGFGSSGEDDENTSKKPKMENQDIENLSGFSSEEEFNIPRNTNLQKSRKKATEQQGNCSILTKTSKRKAVQPNELSGYLNSQKNYDPDESMNVDGSNGIVTSTQKEAKKSVSPRGISEKTRLKLKAFSAVDQPDDISLLGISNVGVDVSPSQLKERSITDEEIQQISEDLKQEILLQQSQAPNGDGGNNHEVSEILESSQKGEPVKGQCSRIARTFQERTSIFEDSDDDSFTFD